MSDNLNILTNSPPQPVCGPAQLDSWARYLICLCFVSCVPRRRLLNSHFERWPFCCFWSSPSQRIAAQPVLSRDTSSMTSTSISSSRVSHFFNNCSTFRCSSKFYYDFHRCKLEREEAARRGLNRRSRQIHHNSATKAGQASSLVFVAVFAAISTQKCHWWPQWWPQLSAKSVYKALVVRAGHWGESTRIARNSKSYNFKRFDANRWYYL